jgi:hypothetical protein
MQDRHEKVLKTGMRWQWAWRGALWVTEVGKVKEGLD